MLDPTIAFVRSVNLDKQNYIYIFTMLSNTSQWDSFPTLDQMICDSPSNVQLVNTTPANWNTMCDNNNNVTWNPQTSISAQFSAQRAELAKSRRIQKPQAKPKRVSKALESPEKYTKVISTVASGRKNSRTPRAVAPQTLKEFIESLRSRHENDQHNDKPPYAYATMIMLALLQSDRNRLTLSQIYKWMTTHFPFFQMSQQTWQNSIRHNLSLNKSFAKTEKSPDKKSFYWEFQRGSETRFFRNLDLSFEQLKSEIKNMDQYFNIVPSITIEPVKKEERRDQQLPTPPTTNDHSLNIGLAPAFEISASTNLKVPLSKPQFHVLPKSHSSCSIEEGLDALKTPEFKNYESMVCSPLTPNRLQSIHNSNVAFFEIWNESHSF